MPKIVLSYRRRDSQAITGRIFDRLVGRYGRDAVFRDIDNIPPGTDFRAHIAEVLRQSDVLLAIVGPGWAGRSERGRRARIDDEDDLVRIEVETALQRGIPLIPVLLDRTRMPRADQVPESIKEFAYRHAVRVDPGQDFEHHVDRLMREIDRIRDTDSEAGEAVVAAAPNAAAPASALLDKPSIAVLPFTNMSGEPDQEFVADGISEDVITALSRYPSLFVTARNSCFTYKGRAVDVKVVGRELGVRYVLGGSLRKAGNRVRLTAQLVEAETGNHIWAERYDRDLADIFALQDEITEAVTIAIAPVIADAERQRAMRKPPGSLDAWSAYQRGLSHLGKFTVEDSLAAQQFFQLAIDLDPHFAGGYTGLSRAQSHAAGSQRHAPPGSPGADLAANRDSAEALARRAVALDPNDAEARTRLGQALMQLGDYAGALAEVEAALSISPNLAAAHAVRGGTLMWSGHPREGRIALENSLRLDPHDAMLNLHMLNVAISYYLAGEYESAVEAAQRVIRAYPDYPNPYRWLAAALGQTGAAEAKATLDKAIAIAPASFDLFVRRRVPWHRPEDHAHMLEGLRKAGWNG